MLGLCPATAAACRQVCSANEAGQLRDASADNSISLTHTDAAARTRVATGKKSFVVSCNVTLSAPAELPAQDQHKTPEEVCKWR